METTETDVQRDLNRLLAECVARAASDLHLVPGLAPHFRYHGELLPVGGWPAVAAAGTRALAVAMLARALASRRNHLDLDAALAQRGSVDGALSAPDGARFRFNVFYQRGAVALAARLIPYRIPSFGELGLPAIVQQFALYPHGLVLLTGPAGSGKSTTLAAMIDHINTHR